MAARRARTRTHGPPRSCRADWSSSEKPPDDREELVGREGLRQVLVRALTHAPDAVTLLVLRADHDHARLLGPLVSPHAAERLEAVPLGHHDVEQHDVGLLLE